ARQAETDQKNAHTRSLVAAAERLAATKREERVGLFRLYSKKKDIDDSLTALWEAEDSRLHREIEDQERQIRELQSQLVNPQHTPEYFRTVKAACARIAHGIEHFTLEEKREAYELLDLKIELAVEDGYRIAYADCVLDAKRLTMGAIKNST